MNQEVLGFLQKTALLVFTWVLLTWAGPGNAQNLVVVRLDPTEISLAPDGTAGMVLLIEEAQDVFGLEIRLTFDPAVIRIVDAESDLPGIQLAPGNFLDPDKSFLVANQVDNQEGELIYALTLLAPAEPVSGGGVIAAFEVHAQDVGTSQLTLTVILASKEGSSLPASANGGQIVVAGATEPTFLSTFQAVPSATPTALMATITQEGISTSESPAPRHTGGTRIAQAATMASPAEDIDQNSEPPGRDSEGGSERGIETEAAGITESERSLSNTSEVDVLAAGHAPELTGPESRQGAEESESGYMVRSGESMGEGSPENDPEGIRESDSGGSSFLDGGLVLVTFVLFAAGLYVGRRFLSRKQMEDNR